MRFKSYLTYAALGAIGLLAGASASAQTATGQPKVFAGTVELHSTQIAFIASGSTGGGTLEYQGGEYHFSIGGLGIGGIGVQSINAVGAVYNLTDVSKFAGTYVQARAGITAGSAGGGKMALSNEHGVIMELKFSGKGLALSLGADGMIVSMN